MSSDTYQYVYIENHIPDDVCDLLVASCSDWKQAQVNQAVPKKLLAENRISDSHWIQDQFWKQTFLSIIQSINRNSFGFDINGIEDLQLTRYVAPNGHYHFHQDGNGYNPIINNLCRKISMSVVLNNDFEGGEFEYMVSKDPVSIKLGKGDIIIFPSYLLHRVKPVTKGTRYSLVGWSLGNQLK